MIEIIAPKTIEEMEKIWEDATRNIMYGFQEDENNPGYWNVEIYKDYRDKIGDHTLKEAFKYDYPMDYIMETMEEWAIDYACEYGDPEIHKEILSNMSDEDREITEDFYQEEFDEWRQKHISYYYDWEDWNRTIKVNLVVDSGDANYDFACNSILNWYGTTGYDECTIDEHSSIMWLAKQQGKENEVRKEIEYVFNNRERNSKDRFVESVIDELENLPQYGGMLTFLLEMTIEDLCKLKQRDKDFSKVIISKDTMCGLFESWNGSGSILDIKLDKDVEVPAEMIWDAWMDGTKPHGYDVDEVYGLIGSAWHGTLKMIA